MAKPVEKPVNEYVERIVEVGKIRDLDTKNLCVKTFQVRTIDIFGGKNARP